MRFIDLAGQTFGRLYIESYAGRRGRKSAWLCRCDCGGSTVTTTSCLRSGHTISCGCFHKEIVAQTGRANITHGDYGSPTYISWKAMHARCGNPNHEAYDRYAGRGIGICDRWGSYENFRADLGERPVGMTLERVDNDKGYDPSNCVWATPSEQALNRRQAASIQE
jgi:hypothetical protein